MRRRRPERREILPDPLFGDLVVAKFVNNLMVDGKKSIAEKLFYNSLNIILQREKKDGLEVFKKALENVSPLVEVKSKRIGGATYQVPTEVKDRRRTALAMRWLIQYSRARKGQTMSDKLAAEFISASKGEGGSFKKKEDTHRMAEANRAFSHFRF